MLVDDDLVHIIRVRGVRRAVRHDVRSCDLSMSGKSCSAGGERLKENEKLTEERRMMMGVP